MLIDLALFGIWIVVIVFVGWYTYDSSRVRKPLAAAANTVPDASTEAVEQELQSDSMRNRSVAAKETEMAPPAMK